MQAETWHPYKGMYTYKLCRFTQALILFIPIVLIFTLIRNLIIKIEKNSALTPEYTHK